MTELQAISTIYEGLSGTQSLTIKLRRGEGLDAKLLAEIKDALKFLKKEWKSSDKVSKKFASAIVDINSAMEEGRDKYPEKEQNEIEDAAVELVDLIYQVLE